MVDLYMNPITHDLDLVDGLLRLTQTREELVRQKLDITLNTFLREWDYDINYGTPYFQEILGKGKDKKTQADVALVDVIQRSEGIEEILEFSSSIDSVTREYTVTFRALINSGEIISVETTI